MLTVRMCIDHCCILDMLDTLTYPYSIFSFSLYLSTSPRSALDCSISEWAGLQRCLQASERPAIRNLRPGNRLPILTRGSH
jgi:hypothetical protein